MNASYFNLQTTVCGITLKSKVNLILQVLGETHFLIDFLINTNAVIKAPCHVYLEMLLNYEVNILTRLRVTVSDIQHLFAATYLHRQLNE